MIYFISDTHFYHYNIITYCDRPFDDIEIMNEKMIEAWNSVVTDQDIVYFLGDFGFGDKEMLTNICSQLNGEKIMLRGNHDYKRGKQSWCDIGFKEVHTKRIHLEGLTIDGFDEIVLSHEPMNVEDNIFNIHGHIHNVPLSDAFNKNNHFCVSVEMIDYVPITLEQIQKKMSE